MKKYSTKLHIPMPSPARMDGRKLGTNTVKGIVAIWFRFRAWRLNRWADSLLKDAEYHKRAATQHRHDASMYWWKSSDVRALARRIYAN